MSKERKLNYRHVICVLITLGFVACCVFIFPNALGRIIESCRDIGLSLAYYFCKLCGIETSITPSVNDLPKIPFFGSGQSGTPEPSSPLPETFEGFKNNWSLYWKAIINKDNLIAYLNSLSNLLYYLSYFLLIFIPFVLVFRILFQQHMKQGNNNYNQETRPLKVFKRVVDVTYIPIKNGIRSFVLFLCENRVYLKIWLFLWLFNFNVITIIIEFIAYYFFFVVSFDISSLYRQFYKLFLDLSVPLKFIPVWAWLIAGVILFDYFRKKIAYARLDHMEILDKGFINSLPIVSMVVGTMNKKKTTMLTDMALSQAVIFRDKALEKLLENDLKFQHFPWINLENGIKAAMNRHEIFNLATCKKYVAKELSYFHLIIKKCEKRGVIPKSGVHQGLCFGYDYSRYGMTYDNKLHVAGLWEVIEIYTQLYFIYVIESSLLVSNYSVRTDNIKIDSGNFPLWDNDFFRRESYQAGDAGCFAHILDFDTIRLGRKIIENNKKANAFEFGVVVITESGKERGNQFDTRGQSKTDREANRKSDLFDTWLKMARHSATVDNFPFIKVIMDEQRPESLGADVRELCDIIEIEDSSEMCLAMPFFSLEALIYDLLFPRFTNFYYDHRHSRGDTTLILYLYKKIAGLFHSYYTCINNRFSFYILKTAKQRGTQDGRVDERKYYIMSKKIYSKRFATDAFNGYFVRKSLKSDIGLADLQRYDTERATFYEMHLQNSHFVNDIQECFK